MSSVSDNPLLFVPIETKVREFHGKLLFSLAAVEEGFDVILAGQQALQKELHKFGRGLYLDKSVAVTRKKWFRRCKAMGNRVTSWDEEGLVYFDQDSYLELRADRDAFDQTELFVAWGDDLKEALLKKFPDAETKIFCGGNPRFDLLRNELRDFFKEKVDQINRRFGEKIILINTNFGFCNHFRGVEAARKTLQTYPISQSRPGFFDGWIEAQQVMFTAFKEILPRMSRDFPDCTIIVRPHPSENRQVWEEFCANFDNMEVNAEGNVVEWILASRVLVHFNCTTAIEAFMVDVPAIAFKPHDIGDYEQKLPNALSYQVEDYDALASLIDTNLKKQGGLDKTDEQVAVARRFITGIDGTLAADRIAKAVKKYAFSGKNVRTPGQRAYTFWRAFWLFGRKLKEMNKPVDYYDKQKFPGLSTGEIAETISVLSEVSGRFKAIEVRQVTDHCYLLSAGAK